jgi:predicted glycogen debranching enzyme
LITVGREILQNYEKAKRVEWVVTNGLGGYSSSSVIGANSRGYHGLLVASIDPPVKRYLLLTKIEEEVVADDHTYLLAVNKYPGTIYPLGNQHLEEFRFEFFPSFIYRFSDYLLEKTVTMVHGENTTIVTYKLLEGPAPIKLSLYPLINCRDFHSRTHEGSGWNLFQTLAPKGCTVKAYQGSPVLYLFSDLASYYKTGMWYKNLVYDLEAERGLPDREDHFNPGYFSGRVDPGVQISILASTVPTESFSAEGRKYREFQRSRKLISKYVAQDTFLQTLVWDADSFLVRRNSVDSKTIIAGYHWFSDWGRDTMISLPGITLVSSRFDDAKAILSTFSKYLKNGLIPNRFPDDGSEAEYSSVDAALWFVYAVYKYFAYSNDLEFVEKIYPVLTSVIDSYQNGTLFDIHLRSGLVFSADDTRALTWMDASVGGKPVTPRAGSPVEVSALWFNALKTMEVLAEKLGRNPDKERFAGMAEETFVSFNRRFWNEETECLYDVVGESETVKDGSIRPNQVLAISLPFPVLAEEKWKPVMKTIDFDLLTPVGLRTLSSSDASYRGKCIGPPNERDLAYHQGTVWPWLLGQYITAYVKLNKRVPRTMMIVRQFYEPFKKRLVEAGVGTISEIFDGDPPHEPRGCISQAWSVAEILRSYLEDASTT